MVARPGQYQFSFNAGELAPAVWGNTGLKQFYAGAAQMVNAEPVPQGGFRAMARLRYQDQLPFVLAPTPVGGRQQAAVRLFDFTYARLTAAYVIALTPGQAAIYKNGVKQTIVVTPYQADDLPFLKRVQRFDTMLLFHPSYPPGRLLRNGSDTAWTYDAPPFTNVPSVKLEGTYVDTPEIWIVAFYFTATGSNTAPFPNGTGFVISVDGQATNQLTINQSAAADWQTAIDALPTCDPGVTVVQTFSNENSQIWQITFTGGTNPGANFVVGGNITNFNGAANVTFSAYRETIGVPGGEPLFSATAGYPSCGQFYQDRLAMGGFQAKTSAFSLSRTGEYFDTNIRVPTSPSAAVLFNLDTDGAERIVDIVQSKHLVIFTSEADYYISDRAISASTAPNIVQSETHGCSARVPPVKQEAGLIYANRDETIVFASTYDAVSDAYVASPLTLLSSHLVTSTRDAAMQKSYVATDAERYWMVRDDGVMVVGELIRNQEVTGFVRYVTDGTIEGVTVDGDNVVHLAIMREIYGGQPALTIETVEDGLWLDAAITVTLPAPSNVVGGFGIHQAETVWAIADGFLEGPLVVANGAVTLAEPATTITVGRWSPPIVETLPLVRDVAAHTVLKRPARVHTMTLDLVDTTSLAIAANGGAVQDVVLTTTAQPTDTPPLPMTGQKRVAGLIGWSTEGQVTITQVRPGALQLRDLTVSAKI